MWPLHCEDNSLGACPLALPAAVGTCTSLRKLTLENAVSIGPISCLTLLTALQLGLDLVVADNRTEHDLSEWSSTFVAWTSAYTQ